MRARTAAINELKALVVTADDDLRAELRNLTTRALVATCEGFRSSRARSVTQQCTKLTMRALAQRIAHLNNEIADHDRAMTALLRQTAPQLLGEAGIGHVTAATFVLAGLIMVAAATKLRSLDSPAPPPSRRHPDKLSVDSIDRCNELGECV